MLFCVFLFFMFSVLVSPLFFYVFSVLLDLFSFCVSVVLFVVYVFLNVLLCCLTCLSVLFSAWSFAQDLV